MWAVRPYVIELPVPVEGLPGRHAEDAGGWGRGPGPASRDERGRGGVGVGREGGLPSASPAGEGAGVSDGVALVPFRWDHVDASCVLPPLGSVRERIAGSPDPLDPGAFLAYLEAVDVKEIHGYNAAFGLRVFREQALE